VELEVARPEAVTVPVDAIVDGGVRRTVFVQTGEGTFEPRAVETGWRAGGRAEIRRGLAAGEVIVTSGTFHVDSESQLRELAASPPAAAAAQGPQASPAVDPVCSMPVEPAAARAAGRVHDHGGETFYFCSDGCRSAFAADPARFAHP
jgi:YHS domain-containing protein